MTFRSIRTLCLAATLAFAGWAQAADQKLLTAARAAQPAVIESLREMVLIEFGSQDAAGLKSLAGYLEGRLRALGATIERLQAGVGPGKIVKATFTGSGAELDGRKLILHPRSGGGTDAGYAGRSGKAAVLESLGLAGWGYHAKNEYIEIDSIVPRLYLSTRLLSDLATE